MHADSADLTSLRCVCIDPDARSALETLRTNAVEVEKIDDALLHRVDVLLDPYAVML